MVVKAKNSLPGHNVQNDSRLGQKFGIRGDELDYTLVPPKKQGEKTSESEYDLMAILQKIYDLVEAEPGLDSDIKDKISRLLAKYYHQEEPGFSDKEAHKLIIRDYHLLRDIPDRSASKPQKNQGSKKKKQSVTNPGLGRPLQPPPVTAAAPTEPTLTDIMAGRPFGPMDFMGNMSSVNQRRRAPGKPLGMNNMMPGMQPGFRNRPRRAGYPPMMGLGAPMGRRPGFGFMGFPVGMMPGSNFIGRPW